MQTDCASATVSNTACSNVTTIPGRENLKEMSDDTNESDGEAEIAAKSQSIERQTIDA